MTELDLKLQEILSVAEEDPVYQKLKETILHGFPEMKCNIDQDLTDYWNVREELYVADDGFVMNGNRLIIPKKLKTKILKDIHAGHRGKEACKSRARQVVYWPRIDHDIDVICESCQKCEYDRPSNPREPNIKLPQPSRAFEIISADFAEYNGLSFLIITDWKSGWFSTRPVKKKDAKNAILELRSFIADTAVPKYLYTDNGQPFPSAEFQDFLKRWGIQWISSSPFYAQSNTYAENGVKSAKALLRKCVVGKKIDYEEWDKGLLAIRNTPNKSGLSPAVILYGHMVKEILPAHKKALQRSWHKELSEFDKKIAEESQKVEEKRGRELKPLNIGDPVVVQNRTTKRWDKYAVVQEVHHKARRYLVRMSSGLLTVRNRRDLRKRYPSESVPKAGTSEWDPFSKPKYVEDQTDEDEEDDDEENYVSPVFHQPDAPDDTDNPTADDQPRGPDRRVRFTEPTEPRRSTRTRRQPSYLKDYVRY